MAIIDISLKCGNGIDLIKRLRVRDESVRIVVWSMYPERLYAERALRAGAMGYVNKGSETREILQAIRTVLAGRVYLSEEISARLLGRVVGGQQAHRSFSRREPLGPGTGGVQAHGRGPDHGEDRRDHARQPQDGGDLPGAGQGEAGAE